MKKKQPPDSLDDFLTRVEEFNTNLGKLNDNVAELRLVQGKVLGEPSASERQKHLNRQQNLVKENKTIGANLHKQIKDEKARTEKMAKQEENSSEAQIRRTQMQACSRRFLDIWTEYNNAQLEFKAKNKKALLRNIKIVDPHTNMTNEELEEKLEAGDLTVVSSIIKESAQAKEELKQLEDRYAEIVKLEKGITEVHDMFLDLSNMVELQGEAVGRIADTVNQAATSAEEGRKQLHQAEKKQKAARKLKMILAAVGSGVSATLIVILVFLL